MTSTAKIVPPDKSTLAAAQTGADDQRRQERESPKSKCCQDTTQLLPPVDPHATHGEVLEATPAQSSVKTDQRIDREIAKVEKTGEVLPRSILSPAKPAREPSADEQRMAEDFDPPPLGHRADMGSDGEEAGAHHSKQ